jgi:UDPglucose 6-dehydrogenase
VASVSVANTLAELSEGIGADWHEIAPALRLDRRIGAYAYLAPGLGIAGGNLERDLATVIRLADERGTDAGVIEAFVRNSRRRRDWVLQVLERHVFPGRPDPLIAILGLAYKVDTHSTKNSPALALIRALPGRRLKVHDPVVREADGLRSEASALDAIAGADVLAVMTPWSEYRALDPAAVCERLAGRWVIDPYGVFDARVMSGLGVDYATLGRPIEGGQDR